MSSQDNADSYAEIALAVQSIRTNNYIAMGALAFVVYDYVITFDREVSNVWRRKFTAASALFYVNRYLSIVSAALVIFMNSITEQQTCSIAGRIYQGCIVALLMVFALFSALRVYVLWNKNILLLCLILALDMVPVATNLSLYIVVTLVAIGPPYSECITSDPRPIELDLKLTRLTRACVIAADALVIVLIWIKTFTLHRQARQLRMKTSLATLFLRDGTLYFIVLLVVNTSHFIVYEITRLPYISIFLTSTTAVLISRFVMNLRQATDERSCGDSGALDQFSMPAFRTPSSFVGELGASLHHSGCSFEHDDDPVDTAEDLSATEDYGTPEHDSHHEPSVV